MLSKKISQSDSLGILVSPQPLKASGISRRVPYCVLDISVSQIILNQAGIRALIGQSKAAAMAQHMRASMQRQGSRCAVFSEQQIDSRAVQRLALAADKECFHVRRQVPCGNEAVVTTDPRFDSSVNDEL